MDKTEQQVREFLRKKPNGRLHHRENQELEFKEQFNFAGLAEYLRDFAAFANNRGGYVISRRKTHEDRFNKTGILPSGTPSIYNDKAVAFICRVLDVEAMDSKTEEATS